MSTLFKNPQNFQSPFPGLEDQLHPASVSGYTSVPSAVQGPWFRWIKTPVESGCVWGNVVWAQLTDSSEAALARSEDLGLSQL